MADHTSPQWYPMSPMLEEDAAHPAIIELQSKNVSKRPILADHIDHPAGKKPNISNSSLAALGEALYVTPDPSSAAGNSLPSAVSWADAGHSRDGEPLTSGASSYGPPQTSPAPLIDDDDDAAIQSTGIVVSGGGVQAVVKGSDKTLGSGFVSAQSRKRPLSIVARAGSHASDTASSQVIDHLAEEDLYQGELAARSQAIECFHSNLSTSAGVQDYAAMLQGLGRCFPEYSAEPSCSVYPALISSVLDDDGLVGSTADGGEGMETKTKQEQDRMDDEYRRAESPPQNSARRSTRAPF